MLQLQLQDLKLSGACGWLKPPPPVFLSASTGLLTEGTTDGRKAKVKPRRKRKCGKAYYLLM